MNNTIWSDYVQTTQELYLSRALRFREDNKELWLRGIGLRDGMRVLEVGSGSGIFCHRIKTFLPGCPVTGVDLDSGHTAWAKKKTAQSGLPAAVRWQA